MTPLDFIIPSVHLDQDLFWARTLGGHGHRVFFIHGAVDYDPVWFDISMVGPNVVHLRYEDFLKMDDRRMVIFVQCLEHEAQVYEQLVPAKPNARVIHAIGNNIYQPGRSPGRIPKNLIALDIQAFGYWQAKGVENLCYVQAGCDDELYAFTPLRTDSKPRINCYIQGYVHGYPRGWGIYEQLRSRLADFAEFRLFGADNPDGFLLPAEAVIVRFPPVEHSGRQIDELRRSWMTVHIKEWEGYGFNVVKSLLVGRPVIALKDMIFDKTMQYFCVDGVSAIMEPLSRLDILCDRVRRYIARPNELAELCESAQRYARMILSPDTQWKKLERFLERLA
jgi:hypothetical protein